MGGSRAKGIKAGDVAKVVGVLITRKGFVRYQVMPHGAAFFKSQ